MSRFVPYLADEAIERDAVSLIEEYEQARGVTIEPPIPIEDILEKHLKLRIEFDDLHARHNVPRPENGQTDILGAIYGDGSIFIDESLDPEENPVREGRYRFTLAHEGGGHWRLHQHLIKEATSQASLFGDDGGRAVLHGRGRPDSRTCPQCSGAVRTPARPRKAPPAQLRTFELLLGGW